jgi:Protein of unknown function (DUF2924)
MRPTRPVAKKATRPSLDDEIARLRDLDLHGLRARWKSMFRQQPPYHLPRHLLFAVLAYRLQAGELGDLDPATARLLRQIATGGGTREASRRTAGWAAQNHVADAAARIGFQQLKVKVWLRSGIQIELMFSCGTNAANFARRQAGIQPVLG